MLHTLKMIGVLLAGMVLIYGIITVGLMAFRSVHFVTFFVVVTIQTLLLSGGSREFCAERGAADRSCCSRVPDSCWLFMAYDTFPFLRS
jgi:hypothetical protein